MGHKYPTLAGRRILGLFVTLAAILLPAAAAPRPDWRHIGAAGIELGLASPGSGPVARAWFSADGSRLFARTASGRVFETSDYEHWRLNPAAASPAEPGGDVRTSALNPLRRYRFNRKVERSDDAGESWSDITTYQRESIIGPDMRDLAVSPRDPDELVVANSAGLWRSLDGGLSWTGLNEALPNLPVRRLAGLPQGSHGLRVTMEGLGELEWAPGERSAWRRARDGQDDLEAAVRDAWSRVLGVEITAMASAADYLYAGGGDGRLWVSSDKGRGWRESRPAAGGRIESLFADPREPRVALAALGARVLRTTNGGIFWDDLTADLPEAPIHGITADRATGTIYVATERGVFFTRGDLMVPAPATPWVAIENLPAGPARDVRLDAEANQLYVALEGYGVYAAMAPHREGSFRLVNAADFSGRAAAPGSLLSVLGGKVQSARAGDLRFPILAATDSESQIQVPFEARGASVSLALNAGRTTRSVGVSLQPVSPAIFVDRDGAPLLLDADSGVLLDGTNPARTNSRIQVLATGLGRVLPEWPTGMAAPSENPPRVLAPVRAYLDRAPVEVTRAVLAPGYIGLYLIELQLPALVNAGPAELYLEADGLASNRVRVYVEP